MAQRVRSLSEGVHLNRIGLGLGRAIGDVAGMKSSLLDVAVAITEGAELDRMLCTVGRIDARIMACLEDAVQCVEPPERRTAIANYILSVSIGMQLPAGPD